MHKEDRTMLDPLRTARRARRLSSLLLPTPEPDQGHRFTLRAGDIVVLALWFGLLTGVLEAVLVLAQNELAATITMTSLRTNEQVAWMIPTANVVLFGLCGVVFAWLARTRARLAQRLACGALAGLLPLALLVRIEGLYP